MNEIETHPFKPFVPARAIVMILGTFPGRKKTLTPGDHEWFYGSRRNQFWNIVRGVYNAELSTTEEKKTLFTEHRIAIGDIFLKIRRKEDNNLDTNLEVIEYNDKALKKIFKQHEFASIFFTSQFVEKQFIKLFPGIKNGECLPSPSPRYARMSLAEKINYYKNKLPK
jgi:hypoxanthine-DNA glycosylase